MRVFWVVTNIETGKEVGLPWDKWDNAIKSACRMAKRMSHNRYRVSRKVVGRGRV